MEKLKNILEECSIHDIYFGNTGTPVVYQIPIYQRNYAWEREEVRALIKDVYDSMGKPVYYIGTLVSYKRDENVYEVIDGQQRLTTIYIILKALGVGDVKNRLTYTARKKSANTIENLPRFGEVYDEGIKSGYDFAQDGLREIVGNAQEELEKFKAYFLHGVHIIHYRVPQDVDLNHYFEVMNSRGEQLEKHEIVKASLIRTIKDNPVDVKKFNRIWEACSDMCFYIQQKLSETSVFGNDLADFELDSFDAFPAEIQGEGIRTEVEKHSIASLMAGVVQKPGKNEELDRNDSFQPIIDFPNFLLIVLKLTRMDEDDFDPVDFTLDDKELLQEFGKVNITEDFVKRFAYNLLLAKYYLDNYVVHHSDDADRATENPWKLQYYYKSNKKNAYLKDLAEDKDIQDELVHLLSMFEVAFTPRQRKNYLFYTLLHLFDEWDITRYLYFLRQLADKYFYDIYLDPDRLNDRNQPKPNSFDEAVFEDGQLNVDLDGLARDFHGVYPDGSCTIPLYVFNYTDYRLWKKYASELRGNKLTKGSRDREGFFAQLGCSDFELAPFNNFYFSRTRKSLEHYYPQAKAGDEKPLTHKDINCFGNFAMIGAEANSSGSNYNPIEKKMRYLDSKSNPVSTASLKFRVMLQMCQDNADAGVRDEQARREPGMEWNAEDIKRHQEKMLGIIMIPNSTGA